MKKLLLISLMCLASCKTVDLSYVKKSEAEKEIAKMKADFETKNVELEQKLLKANKVEVDALKAQMQGGSDAFYGQSLVFKSIVEPTRTDLMTYNLSEEGWVALGHMMPSYETMIKINQRIAKELDSTKTTLAELKKNHDEVVQNNLKLVDETKAAHNNVIAIEKEKTEAEAQYRTDLSKKEEALIEKVDAIAQAEKEKANDREATQKAKMKLSIGAGSLATVALLAAIFLPYFKKECGIAAGVLGFASVGIWYLTQTVVLSVFGIGAVGVVFWMFWSHHQVQKTLKVETDVNTDTIRALQRVKEMHPEVWEVAVKPELVEANMKYVEKDGVITKETDPARQTFIDKRLAKVGDK